MILWDFLLFCVALVWRTLGKFGCDEAKLLPSVKRVNDLCCPPHHHCRCRHHHRHRHLCLSHATMRIHLPLIAGISGNKGNERAASYGLIHQELIEASLVSSADRAGVVCAVLCARVCCSCDTFFFFSPPLALHCESVCVYVCQIGLGENVLWKGNHFQTPAVCAYFPPLDIRAALSARSWCDCVPSCLTVCFSPKDAAVWVDCFRQRAFSLLCIPCIQTATWCVCLCVRVFVSGGYEMSMQAKEEEREIK